MKKIKTMLACLLVLSLFMGMQVSAQEGTKAPELSASLTSELKDGKAEVGDVLQFTIKLNIPEANANLGGAFLRFIVSDTEDMNSRTGMPEMKVNEDQKILSDIGKVNGMATARISAGSVGTVEATVSLTVTEDMKGKALFYQTDIRTDGGTESETLAKTAVQQFTVAENESQETIANVALAADIEAEDMDNLPRNEATSVKLTITNIGTSNVSHMYVMGGYNETGWNDPDQVQPFGSFVNLPDGVTQPENGTLYIEEFVSGSTFTITLQGTIPENYAKKDIAFCFAAVSYGKADFDPETDTPIMAATTSIRGKVADKVTENPEPGTPGKDDPSQTDPDTQKPTGTDTNKGTADQTKPQATVQKTVNKKAAPKTGDESSAMAMIMIMAAAEATAVIARKKSRA